MGPRTNSKYLHNSVSDAGRKCAGWPYISVSPMAKSLVSVILYEWETEEPETAVAYWTWIIVCSLESEDCTSNATVCGGMNAFTTLCLWSVGRWQKFIVALASFSVENSISVVDMAWWSIPCTFIGKSFFVKKCFIILLFKEFCHWC